MSLFGQAKRHGPPKPRRSPLPVFAGDSEKFGLSSPTTTGSPLGFASRWVTFLVVPVPGNLPFGSRDSPALGNGYGQPKMFYSQSNRGGRYIRVPLPIPPRLFARVSRLHPLLRIALAAVAIVVMLIFSLGMRKAGPDGRKTWSPLKDPSTVVLSPPEIAKIWEWEVLSGHHPSLAEGERLAAATATAAATRGRADVQSLRAFPSSSLSSTPSSPRRCCQPPSPRPRRPRPMCSVLRLTNVTRSSEKGLRAATLLLGISHCGHQASHPGLCPALSWISTSSWKSATLARTKWVRRR